MVNPTSEDTAQYVPQKQLEKIDTPSWRCLTDHELADSIENEGSSSEDTTDEFYEVLHKNQNERLQELLGGGGEREEKKAEGKKLRISKKQALRKITRKMERKRESSDDE